MDETINQLMTEERNETSQDLDQLSTNEILKTMNNEDMKVAEAVQKSLPSIEQAIEQIVTTMKKGGRLFYIGAGTSGRLGILDASECPPTFGVEREMVTGIIAGGEAAIKFAIENAEDDAEAGKRDIRAYITSSDAVVGLTASGMTPYVLGAIEEANKMGAVTVGLSCNTHTKLSAVASFPIEVLVGPEVITGSTRLKAGTAQKMVLNMITTTTMIKLGKVYGNLMVNVQATNNKLRDRVVRIVKEATGADYETAKSYSEEAKGDARIAILMLKYKVNRSLAQDALQQTNGHFGEAVEWIEGKQGR